METDSAESDYSGIREVPVVDVSCVYTDHVHGRRVVYLDTNIWIALANGSPAQARSCLEACRVARIQRRAIFPVSYAAISELIEQVAGLPQMRRCELMDELSEGVSYRSAYAIQTIEAANALRVLRGVTPEVIDRTCMFSYVSEAIGDTCVSFAPEWTDDMIQSFIAHYWASGAVTSLKWYLQHVNLEAWRRDRLESEKDAQPRFEEALRIGIARHRTGAGKPHRRKALREEHHFLFRTAVLPSLAEIADAAQLRLTAEGIRMILQGDDRLVAKVVSAMPSLDTKCCLLANRIMNPGRSYKPEDYWDIEHAAVPCAYSDVFCTFDRGLRFALRTSDALKNRQCEILSGIDDLQKYVERLN